MTRYYELFSRQVDEQGKWILTVALIFFGLLVLYCAWLAEDAFITFRTVDNLIHGYGLRWNIAERVQSFTHPLWMSLLAVLYFATGEIFYTSILFSALVSILAVLVLSYRLHLSEQVAVLGLSILVCSKAFIDFSTSGLENPLTHLLIGIFVALYLTPRHKARSLLPISLIAGLCALNRMDSLLILLPALIACWWRQRTLQAFFQVAAGFAPFAAWKVFSLLYYGFPLPNTAYAKLGTDIPLSELIQRGAWYLSNSFYLDPLTIAVIAVGAFIPAVRRDRRQLPLALGIALYMLYILRIGGDFMSGRFLSAPLFTAVILLCLNVRLSSVHAYAAAFFILAVSYTVTPRSPLRNSLAYGQDIETLIDEYRISDERGIFYPHTGLVPALAHPRNGEFPDHWWAKRGRQVRKHRAILGSAQEGFLVSRSSGSDQVITTWMNIGLSGFYAGPKVHIIDAMALGDPLLARLPALSNPAWGAGHFGRMMPKGYIETHLWGRNMLVDRDLALYFDKLCRLTRGDLLDLGRLREIWRFNTGQYEYLIDRAAYRFPTELERRRSELRIRPNDPSKYIDLAQAFFAAGQKEEAVYALEKALETNPISFANHYIVAKLYNANQLYDLAETVYHRAIELIANHMSKISAEGENEQIGEYLQAQALMYDGLGVSLVGLHKTQAAERAYLQAIRLHGGNWTFFHNLGVLRLKLNDAQGALSAFQEAFDKGSDNIEAIVAIGTLLQRSGKTDEAVALYRQMLVAPYRIAAQNGRVRIERELKALIGN